MPSDDDSDRMWAPTARYACLRNAPGIRWYDPRTEQEHLRNPVGVDDLLEEGASLSEPERFRLPDHVKIRPFQPPEPKWQVEIQYARLRVQADEERTVDFVTTTTAAASEVFEDREDAVAHACEAVDAFAEADVRDALEWREQRHDDPAEDRVQETLADGGRDE